MALRIGASRPILVGKYSTYRVLVPTYLCGIPGCLVMTKGEGGEGISFLHSFNLDVRKGYELFPAMHGLLGEWNFISDKILSLIHISEPTRPY